MQFEAAVDRWMIGLLSIVTTVMIGSGVVVAFDPDTTTGELLWIWVSNLLIAAFVVALAVPLRYEVAEGRVTIRAGVQRVTVELADVVAMQQRTSFVSSTTAAWTMRRIVLVTERGRSLEVGPRDATGFIAEVLAWAPHLKERTVRGKRVWIDPKRRKAT